MSKTNPVVIRNYDIIKNLFDQRDEIKSFYKLTNRDLDIISVLCLRHTSFNAYIELKTSDFPENRRVVYRSLDKLENEGILTIVQRQKNQHNPLQVYFTVSFIERIAGKAYGKQYRSWLDWQKEFKN